MSSSSQVTLVLIHFPPLRLSPVLFVCCQSVSIQRFFLSLFANLPKRVIGEKDRGEPVYCLLLKTLRTHSFPNDPFGTAILVHFSLLCLLSVRVRAFLIIFNSSHANRAKNSTLSERQ